MGNPKDIRGLSDQGFDDEELEDIMTEIQGLEKEFIQLKEETKKDKKAPKEKTVLQHAMEREVKDSLNKTVSGKKDSNLFDSKELDDLQKDLDQFEDVVPPTIANKEHNPIKHNPVRTNPVKHNPVRINPVKHNPIKKKDEHMKEINSLSQTPSSSGEESGVMNFSGMGRMKHFELDFAVGSGNAKLTVGNGIAVHVAGIEIIINEDEGCRISAPGGIRLSVPIE